MNKKVKGPFDFKRPSPEVLETHPVLLINGRASGADFHLDALKGRTAR